MSDSDKQKFDALNEPTMAPGSNPGQGSSPAHNVDDLTVAPGKDATHKPKSVTHPELDDYEIIDELGRGGMGVVYKARDKKLNRIVALKMILGGRLASVEDLTRFRQEAHAAAKLDHKNIVPIYDVCDEDTENQFFSMKFISGGSLADKQNEFSESDQAVELVSEIAQAVQHAHERGILHRDLKPANILVDEEGNPLITDLGLAKNLGADSGLTQTGMVMGTPGFMAPEQASGKSDITTGADIYSLGAILYWLIAGKPPFEGETQLDVIMQTIQQEPKSIRMHRSGIDKGLDLICQKALKKTPEERYASTAAFNDDLQAWLNGDPLSVKPPTSLELMRIWIRKNFRTFAIGIAAGIACGALIGLLILIVIISENLESTQYFSQLGNSENWTTKYFGWIKSIPAWLIGFLPMLVIYTTVVSGILLARSLKPTTREVSFAAALTAALLAGIVAFTTSLGWAPILRHSVEQGRQDIQLLSDAMWLATPVEKELASKALMQRYPGLKDVDVTQRGNLIRSKVERDQAMGIPQGMWEGIAITLCLAVFPMFFVSVFANMIWMRGARGFPHFGMSFELGIYTAMLCLMITPFFSNQTGPSPGLLIQCVAIAGLFCAIVLALKQTRWYWRIVGFLMGSAALGFYYTESGKVMNAVRVVSFAETDDEIASAARYLETRISRRELSFDRFQIAILYAHIHNDEKYLEHINEMISGYDNMHLPDFAERKAKIILLKPDLHDDSTLALAHELAASASAFENSVHLRWFAFCRALSELRKGNPDETIRWNDRCRDAIGNTSKDIDRKILAGTSHVVDAMAHHHKGNFEAMNASLKKGDLKLTLKGKGNPFWHNWMYFQVLREEALRLKTGTETSPD